MKRIAFMTLGCKVNQADTASMQELFRQAGYEVCEFTEPADIYVVNTCVVTNTGQQKSRQMIRRAIRKENDALIVVTGCYPQTAAEEVKAIDGVDLIIGTQDRAKIVELAEAALARKKSCSKTARQRLRLILCGCALLRWTTRCAPGERIQPLKKCPAATKRTRPVLT